MVKTMKRKLIKALPQTGKRKSVKKDKQLKAVRPGRRLSATGKKYTETRRNRSDKKGSRL